MYVYVGRKDLILMNNESKIISKATWKELKELGVLNVNGMGLTHEDAFMLQRLLKEYRDSLLEKTVSKQDSIEINSEQMITFLPVEMLQ